MFIRVTINYLFFWAVWNWKITLTLWWFEQYLTEQTVHTNLAEYLSYVLNSAEYLYPMLTAVAAMIIIPIIDYTIYKLTDWIINLTKKSK